MQEIWNCRDSLGAGIPALKSAPKKCLGLADKAALQTQKAQVSPRINIMQSNTYLKGWELGGPMLFDGLDPFF